MHCESVSRTYYTHTFRHGLHSIGTCQILLSGCFSHIARGSEVIFEDNMAEQVFRTVSDELIAFRSNLHLREGCPPELYFSQPFLLWYAGVLGNVYSDGPSISHTCRHSELKRSFALRVLHKESCVEETGIRLTLLLPPLWKSLGHDCFALHSDSSINYESARPEYCLLRRAASGRWIGTIIRGEQEEGIRRVFSSNALHHCICESNDLT
jgi:hypothetical protein